MNYTQTADPFFHLVEKIYTLLGFLEVGARKCPARGAFRQVDCDLKRE